MYIKYVLPIFVNTFKWRRMFWFHVKVCWNLSYERKCDILLKTNTGEDAWELEYIENSTNNGRVFLHCYTSLVFSGFYWSSLYGEKHTKNFSWYSSCFWLLLLTHADLVEPYCFCWIRLPLVIRNWCLLLDWTTGILTIRVELPQGTISKQVHNTLFLLAFFSPTTGRWVGREAEAFKNPK